MTKLKYLCKITPEGAEKFGKKEGNYLTMEMQGIRTQDSVIQQKVQEIFTKEFSDFLIDDKHTRKMQAA